MTSSCGPGPLLAGASEDAAICSRDMRLAWCGRGAVRVERERVDGILRPPHCAQRLRVSPAQLRVVGLEIPGLLEQRQGVAVDVRCRAVGLQTESFRDARSHVLQRPQTVVPAAQIEANGPLAQRLGEGLVLSGQLHQRRAVVEQLGRAVGVGPLAERRLHALQVLFDRGADQLLVRVGAGGRAGVLALVAGQGQ